MHDPAWIIGHGLLQIAPRVGPACLVEDLTAEEVARDHTCEAVQPHDFGVPHSPHLEASGMLWLDPETFKRLVAYLACVFHAIAGAKCERHAPKRFGGYKVAVCAGGVDLNGMSRLVLCRLVHSATLARV